MDKTSTRKVSAYVYVELLWKEGFFRDKQILRTVSENITKKWGHNFSPADISKALKKAPFLRRTGKRGKEYGLTPAGESQATEILRNVVEDRR